MYFNVRVTIISISCNILKLLVLFWMMFGIEILVKGFRIYVL